MVANIAPAFEVLRLHPAIQGVISVITSLRATATSTLELAVIGSRRVAHWHGAAVTRQRRARIPSAPPGPPAERVSELGVAVGSLLRAIATVAMPITALSVSACSHGSSVPPGVAT